MPLWYLLLPLLLLLLLLLPIKGELKAECNQSVYVHTVVKIEIVFTVKNRVEHYLHLELHGKGGEP